MLLSKEEVKQKVINGIEKILSHPFLTDNDTKAILRAEKKIYLTDDTVLDKLMAALASQGKMSDEN